MWKKPTILCLFVPSSDRSTQQQVILQARSAAPMMKMEGVFWQGGTLFYLPKIEREEERTLVNNMQVLAGEFVWFRLCLTLCWSIRSVQQPTRRGPSEPQTHCLWPLRGRSIGSVRPRYRRPERAQRRPRVLGPGRPVRGLGVQTTEGYVCPFTPLTSS